MNQGYKRSGADFLTFVPFCSSADTMLNSSVDDTGGSSHYGNVIDLQTYSGYETAIAAIGVRMLALSSALDATVTAHWVTDTSSAFGGSTTLGSTFTLTLKPSSAQSSEEGVLTASVNLNDAGVYRYVRCLVVADMTSGDGDTMTLAPVYVLSGRDQHPSTQNVMIGLETT
jgi:hypothetical protein